MGIRNYVQYNEKPISTNTDYPLKLHFTLGWYGALKVTFIIQAYATI